jgi:hypothetical protein
MASHRDRAIGAAARIFRRRHRLEMGRVAANRVAAQVVNLESFGDCTDKAFVREPVSEHETPSSVGAASDRDLSI